MSTDAVAAMNSVLAHGATVSAIKYSYDGQYVVSASRDKLIKVFTPARMEELRSLRGHTDRVNCIGFCKKDSTVVASGSKDKTIKIWNFHNGNCVKTLRGHSAEVHSVAFSPDGRQLASGSEDMTVILWDVESGDEQARLEGHTGGVLTVCYSAPGRRLVLSGSDDFSMRLWDTQTHKCLTTFTGHADAVTDARFSPVDTQIIASASRDKTIRFWNADTGAMLATLTGHKDVVNQAVFSHDGWRMVSASADNTLKLWDLDSLTEMRRFEGHKGAVAGCDFSADDKVILSASWDATIKVWAHGPEKTKHSQQRPFEKPAIKVEAASAPAATIKVPSPQVSPALARKDTPAAPAAQRPASPMEEKLAKDLEKEKKEAEKWKQADIEAEKKLAEEQRVRKEQEAEVAREKEQIQALSDTVARTQKHEKEIEQAFQARLKALQENLATETRAREEVEAILAQERERWHLPKAELEVGQEFASGPAASIHNGTWLGAPVVVKRFSEPLRSQYYVTVWETHLATRSSMVHPNILTFYGAVLEPHSPPLLITEAMCGSASEASAMSEPLTLREVVGVAADIASALAFLHKRGLAHGSVSGKKILLNSKMTAKLSCLGEYAAVSVSFARPPAPNTEVVPPEGLPRGDPMLGAKADVYGFGVALLELITQQPPDAARQVSHLTRIEDDILKGIVQKCIEPNVDERADIFVIHDFLRKLLTPGTYEPIDACAPPRQLKRGEYGLVFDTPVKARKLPSTPIKE